MKEVEIDYIENERDFKVYRKVISVYAPEGEIIFSGFRLELIQGAKDHYSIRTGSGQWRIFFIWEKNQAWEVDLSEHDYKKVKR